MRVIGSFGEPRSQRNGWSQNLGDFVELVYHGTADFARGVYANVRGNCAECDLDIEGPSGVVRVRYANSTEPGGEEFLRVEIRSGRNDVQKSIFEPGPDGYSSGVGPEGVGLIQEIVQNPGDDLLYDEFVATATADELALLDLAIQGVQYRTVYQPTVIQVSTASGLYIWPNVNYLAGSILTQNTMLGLLRITPNFTPPNTTNVPAQAPTGFHYGWKMAPPTYEASSDGRSSETLEFEFGLWPEFLYGAPV